MFLNYGRGSLAKYYGISLHKSFGHLLGDTVYVYLGFAFYALGYYYATRYGIKQKELRQLAEAKAAQDIAQAEMKQNLLQLENDFLRAQINPHFLYNTLNTFYAKAMPLSQELANGIVTLANIMRYSLATAHGGQLVSLQMEVSHLEHVIDIHRLRFGNDIKIELTTEGPYGLVNIAPLILITLLENAFKHGDVESSASPLRLWLCVDGERIYFTIQNKKYDQAGLRNKQNSEESLGIGLANVRKRLTNVYGDNYTLEVNETNDTYHVTLVIAHGATLQLNTAHQNLSH